MITIGGVDLKNIVTFKEVSVDFNQQLTYVRGRNEDSNKLNPTSNAAGKSGLFMPLANLLLESTPLSLKKGKYKDMHRQGSSIGIPIRDSKGVDWEIIQTNKGYKIYKDGEDQHVRTKPLARQKIQEIFPLSPIEVYSCMYLTTQREHPLQNVSDEVRLSNFVQMFRLDQYDNLKNHFLVKQRALNDKKIELQTLEQQRLGLSKKLEKLKDSGEAVDKDTYKKARSKSTVLDEQLTAINEKVVEAAKSLDLLTKLLEIETTLDQLRADYPYKKAPSEMIEQLEAERDAARAWARYDDQNQEYKKRKAKLEAKLESLGKVRSIETIVKQRDEAKEKLAAVEKKIATFEEKEIAGKEYKKKVAALMKELNNFSKEEIATAKTTSKEKVIARKAKHEHTLSLKKLIHKHVDGKCPTCNGDVDVKVVKRLVGEAEKEIDKASNLLKVIEILEKGKALTKVELDDEFYAAYEKIQEKQLSYSAEVEKLDAQLKDAKTHKEVVAEMKELEIPKKPKIDRPTDLESLDKGIKLCNKIEKEISAKTALLKGHDLKFKGVDSIKAERKAVNARVKNLEDQIVDLRSKKAKLSTIIDQYNQFQSSKAVYENELQSVDVKIEKLRKIARRQKIVNALVKAYGPKGLRALAVDKVCRLFEQNLNHYASYVFIEPFTFTVKATKKGVSILVNRNKGKPNDISDVRNLSGAESNCFRALCLPALLPLIPNERRVNLVVLDEPTSHMCPVSRQKFNDSYLPLLKDIVPNIYIISPHSDDMLEGSNEWLVRKRNGQSSLEIVS